MRVEIEIPATLKQFVLPAAVNERLQDLLDRQDTGEVLSRRERREAAGLVDLAEFLWLLNLRSANVEREQTIVK